KNRRNKFDYDPDSRLFKLAGLLPEGMMFPFDFGFIPGTLGGDGEVEREHHPFRQQDRKSTRLNSSHLVISYAVFGLKKKSTGHHASDTHPLHGRSYARSRPQYSRNTAFKVFRAPQFGDYAVLEAVLLWARKGGLKTT